MVLWALSPPLLASSPFPTIHPDPLVPPIPTTSQVLPAPDQAWLSSHCKALPCPFYLLFRVAGWLPKTRGSAQRGPSKGLPWTTLSEGSCRPQSFPLVSL